MEHPGWPRRPHSARRLTMTGMLLILAAVVLVSCGKETTFARDPGEHRLTQEQQKWPDTYVERDTAQLETITTLRQDNARLTREQQALQHQGVRHQEELGHLQKQYDALVKQHDELAGAHHQLFQRYNLAQRKETR